MATSAGEVEVKLTLNADDFKRLMGESQKSTKDFGNNLDELGQKLLRVFAYEKIAEFFKNSLEAYAESQLAVSKLIAVLGAHGLASEQLVTHLENQSRALEELTGTQQVAITGVQTMLATFGLQGPMLDRATKATVDLSIGMGINLEHAATLVAKAFEGNTTMLGRYGLKVDQTVDSGKQFSALLDQIQQRFGPVAAAQAGTFTGQINAMQASFTHLKEAIGELLSGPAGGLMNWFKSIVDDMTHMIGFLNQVSSATHSIVSVLEGAVIEAVQTVFSHMVNVLAVIVDTLAKIPLVGKAFTTLKSEVNLLKMAIGDVDNAERKAFLNSVSNAQIVVANEKQKQAAFVNTAQVHMNVDDALNKWIAAQNLLNKDDYLKNLAEEYAGYSDFIQNFEITQQQAWEFAKGETNTFTQGFGDSFAKMIVQGKNFGESMKAVFQDMAMQIISYIMEMIVKLLMLFALEQATGVGAGVAAGGMMSGAMADGGMIGEPSVITGLRSGRSILAGEAGPEMVVPMGGGNQTAAEMGGMPQSGGGGGSITINISGQLIEGDSNSWNRLMREQIIPQIRRFTMSSPTGPFNRTRGVV